ncbi:MAG: molybdopterin synthase catalytic subunit [Natronomonas sp.]|jgi:molybdopterin synthase catalytic subunit
MKLLGIAGPSGSGKTTLVERLLDRLGDRGRVATVKHVDHGVDIDREGKDTHRHRTAGAAETHAVTDDGAWFATGDGRTLEGVLESLAPDYDYALVEGYSGVDIPTVALGGRDYDGETVATAPEADAVDLGGVVDALEQQEPFETLGSLVAQAKRSPEAVYSGAIATFTGRVRTKEGPDDPATELLEFERYDGVAAAKMAAIREELEAREGVYEVLLHHRTGVVESGEDIVFVVVLAGHRGEAFETVEDGINRLKAEVPLFKKEVTVTDEFWAHQHDTGVEPPDAGAED